MRYRTVVVGTDGSESSLAAVGRAAEVGAEGALLLVVCAYSPVPARAQATLSRQLGDTRFSQVLGSDAAEQALAVATAHAEEAGAVGVTGLVVEGDPGQALLAVAEERGADLVVVGNRGISTLSGPWRHRPGTSFTLLTIFTSESFIPDSSRPRARR